MTLLELLAAKDAAVQRKEETEVSLTEAQAKLDAATADHANATEAKLAAHKAIHDLLAELGERCIVDDSGTVTIYRAAEPTDADDPGWRSYHPITESTPKTEAK